MQPLKLNQCGPGYCSLYRGSIILYCKIWQTITILGLVWFRYVQFWRVSLDLLPPVNEILCGSSSDGKPCRQSAAAALFTTCSPNMFSTVFPYFWWLTSCTAHIGSHRWATVGEMSHSAPKGPGVKHTFGGKRSAAQVVRKMGSGSCFSPLAVDASLPQCVLVIYGYIMYTIRIHVAYVYTYIIQYITWYIYIIIHMTYCII